jgi:HSP20 family protein
MRQLPLSVEIEEDKVDASFNKGVLTIVLPKAAAAQKQTRKISVRSGA